MTTPINFKFKISDPHTELISKPASGGNSEGKSYPIILTPAELLAAYTALCAYDSDLDSLNERDSAKDKLIKAIS